MKLYKLYGKAHVRCFGQVYADSEQDAKDSVRWEYDTDGVPPFEVKIVQDAEEDSA